MKKRVSSLVLTTLVLLGLSACSSKEESITLKKLESECTVLGESAPSWVCGAYEEESRYVAVGSAPMSKLGHNFSRNEALLNARTNLVNQIELQIKNKAESYMRSTGLKENEMVEKVVTQVTKQTANMTLKNSKQISYWQSGKDNTIYLLVAIDKNSINEQIDTEIKDIVDNEIQIKNSEDALNKLQ